MTACRICDIIFWGDSMTENTTINFDRDLAVVQANKLLRSKQDELSLLEAKIIRLAIAQVLKSDADFKTYSCEVKELADFLGISSENIYRDIRNTSQSLMTKTIFIKEETAKKKNEPNYKIFHWVDYIEYNDGVITFRLSDSLKPYLIGLEKLFTLYGYAAILELPTNYAIRLYELIASYQNIFFRYEKLEYTTIDEIKKNADTKDTFLLSNSEYVFSVRYLREYFNCADKYPNTGDFIRRVIEPSISSIQEKSMIMKVSFRTIQKGRKIVAIVFQIHSFSELEKSEKG